MGRCGVLGLRPSAPAPVVRAVAALWLSGPNGAAVECPAVQLQGPHHHLRAKCTGSIFAARSIACLLHVPGKFDPSRGAVE